MNLPLLTVSPSLILYAPVDGRFGMYPGPFQHCSKPAIFCFVSLVPFCQLTIAGIAPLNSSSYASCFTIPTWFCDLNHFPLLSWELFLCRWYPDSLISFHSLAAVVSMLSGSMNEIMNRLKNFFKWKLKTICQGWPALNLTFTSGPPVFSLSSYYQKFLSYSITCLKCQVTSDS